MNERLYPLIALLSDGKFHSGELLGRALGISRAAVWKMLAGLQELGLTVHAVSGKGYRLSQPIELLEYEEIIAGLDVEATALLKELTLLQEAESTNLFLLNAATEGAPRGAVCLAEYQRGGRGRRGRVWVSPYGSNIYLSLLWRFNEGTSRLGGLSLAVAVAVMRALSELNPEMKAGIKWPNDILVDNKKLGGILVDVAGENHGPCYAVIGIGLNYRMPEDSAKTIEQPWSDLWNEDLALGRNRLVSAVLNQLLPSMEQFSIEGLAPFRAEWEQWDVTCGHTVSIHNGENVSYGTAEGIDDQGLLLVRHNDGIRHHASGEVSLRKSVG